LDLKLGVLQRVDDQVAPEESLPQIAIGENHYVASIMEVA
jgi:hypothetical protein